MRMPALTPRDGGGMCLLPTGLRAGDIIVTRRPEFMSRMIRLGTMSHISHAMLFVGEGKVVEALTDGVCERDLDSAISGTSLAVAYRRRGISESQGEFVASVARTFAQAGIKYDYAGAANSFMQHTSGRSLDIAATAVTGVPIGFLILSATRTSYSQNRFFCSELVVEAYRRAGLPIVATGADQTSPERMREAVDGGVLEYLGHLFASPSDGKVLWA